MKKKLKNLFLSVKYLSLIWGNVTIDPSASVRLCIIRGQVNIGPHASLYRSDIYGNVFVGESTSLTGPGLYIHALNRSVILKSFISIAPGVKIITSGHDLSAPSTSFRAGGLRIEENIEIGHHCWIGAGAIITGGTEIDDYCVVASGGVATGKQYGGYSVWGGVPLIRIGSYNPNE